MMRRRGIGLGPGEEDMVEDPDQGLAGPHYSTRIYSAPRYRTANTAPDPPTLPALSRHIRCPSCIQISAPRVMDFAFHLFASLVIFGFLLLRSVWFSFYKIQSLQ